MTKKIALLCSDCFSSRAVYHHISQQYEIGMIIVEEPMRGPALIKRRLKKLGFFKVAGQVMFSILIVPFLRSGASKRLAEIIAAAKMSDAPLPTEKLLHVSSANHDESVKALTEYKPDIVIVNGTRILSRKLLNAVKAVFINMHTGITPQYRGVHGGYWAVANNDLENCGVTIHLVDAGIDTGNIVYQSAIEVTSKDNFITYPYLQFAAGIPLELKAVEDVINERLTTREKHTSKGTLWSHPTIWQYLYRRIFKGKK
jgi:folate-dependent phosphoribosylglycinamide formyltransferase PurN